MAKAKVDPGVYHSVWKAFEESDRIIRELRETKKTGTKARKAAVWIGLMRCVVMRP